MRLLIVRRSDSFLGRRQLSDLAAAEKKVKRNPEIGNENDGEKPRHGTSRRTIFGDEAKNDENAQNQRTHEEQMTRYHAHGGDSSGERDLTPRYFFGRESRG